MIDDEVTATAIKADMRGLKAPYDATSLVKLSINQFQEPPDIESSVDSSIVDSSATREAKQFFFSRFETRKPESSTLFYFFYQLSASWAIEEANS